MNSPDIQTVKK